MINNSSQVALFLKSGLLFFTAHLSTPTEDNLLPRIWWKQRTIVIQCLCLLHRRSLRTGLIKKVYRKHRFSIWNTTASKMKKVEIALYCRIHRTNMFTITKTVSLLNYWYSVECGGTANAFKKWRSFTLLSMTGWPIMVHGTRESQGPGLMSEGTVSANGCALSDPVLPRCIGWFICAFTVTTILQSS